MTSNHRIITDGSDWMRDVERRVGRQERRPAPVDVKATFGTAINRNARQIADWNDPEALTNGWYYSEAFGISSPDPDYLWMGECIVTHDGHGTQSVWSHGAPRLYQYARTFHWHENEAPTFGTWEMIYRTPDTSAQGPAPNGPGISGSTYYARDSGQTVTVRVWADNNTGATTTQATNLFTLPYGYRPLFGGTYGDFYSSATGAAVAVAFNTNGTAYFVLGQPPGQSVIGTITYITGDL